MQQTGSSFRSWVKHVVESKEVEHVVDVLSGVA